MSVIAANTDVPVSVKCRIGVDDHDSYNELCKVSTLFSLVRKHRLLFLCLDKHRYVLRLVLYYRQLNHRNSMISKIKFV